MPLVTATRSKLGPNLLSRSRIRYFSDCPKGVASRSCCVVQASVGERVTPTWMTLRECRSIMKKANRERKKRSVTYKRITRPDVFGMVLQEGSPGLSSLFRGSGIHAVLQNGTLAEAACRHKYIAA